MRRMREHVYRLHCLHLIILVQQRKVARLGCRIAAYIYNAPRACTDYRLHHVGVHPGTRWVGYHNVRTAVCRDEVVCQYVFHVAGVEQRVYNSVDFRIDLGVLYGFRDVFYPDNLTRIARYEVRNSTGAGVQVYTSSLPVSPAKSRTTE